MKTKTASSSTANASTSKVPVVMNSVYLFAGCAAMNSINLGFDIGVNTDVGPSLLKSDLMHGSEKKLSLFMGSLNLWAIGGAFLASLLADQLGRRKSFAVASVGFIIGVVCMAAAQTFTQLMLGRVVVGLGCGFGFAVDPVYISEISPPHARGRLVTWSEIGTNIGILVGWCAGYVLKDLDGDQSWRAMLGTGCVLPVVMLLLVKFVMPESPRWLIRTGRVREAKDILVQLYPPGEDIDEVVQTIENNIAVETRESGSVTWTQMFHPNPALKRMLLVGIGVAVCQQLVGIDAIQYFLLFIMAQSGICSKEQQFRYLIMIGFLKLSCIFVAGALFDSRGRRPLMFYSCAGMGASMLLLAGRMYSLQPRAQNEDACDVSDGSADQIITSPTTGSTDVVLPIFALCLYMASFSLGMGPGAWLIPSEVFSNAVRAKAMSMATVANRLAATFMATMFLIVADMLTYAGVLIVLALLTTSVGVFMYLCLPETKGKSLEEMLRYFQEITKESVTGKGGDAVGGLLSDRDTAAAVADNTASLVSADTKSPSSVDGLQEVVAQPLVSPRAEKSDSEPAAIVEKSALI